MPCSFCRRSGHNRTTCLRRQKELVAQLEASLAKEKKLLIEIQKKHDTLNSCEGSPTHSSETSDGDAADSHSVWLAAVGSLGNLAGDVVRSSCRVLGLELEGGCCRRLDMLHVSEFAVGDGILNLVKLLLQHACRRIIASRIIIVVSGSARRATCVAVRRRE